MVTSHIKNKKILVVSGGWSSERRVSLKSGKNVFKSLRKQKFNVFFFDLKKNNLHKIIKLKPYLIFNALHGEFGEDGGLSCFANKHKIRITHSNQISSILCMDKKLCKKYLSKFIKICTPKTYSSNNHLQFPLIIKPNYGGSSIGVKVIKDITSFNKINKKLLKNYIIEEKININKELTVTVIEDEEKIESLGVTEIIFNSKIYNYKSKYTKGFSKHIIPANLNSKDYRYLMNISKTIFKILGCKSIARIDFIMRKNNSKNEFFFLEINTHPGLTDISLAPEQAKSRNISYGSLVKKIVNTAYEA
ncbi:MAG: hypothetical protein CMI90_06535 [Pelagibacteraceae bacterium]|nr:hypothetical protein [Pelagibacteraceae bacterium]|tara:strand:- start:228 stop:1142 length:915 start_codon:yes stop_codon:yes gene_type:complete